MKKITRLRDLLFFSTLILPTIILLVLFFGTLEVLGILKIHGKNNLPKLPIKKYKNNGHQSGLLLIANHPSFYEPLILGYIFVIYIVRNPFKYFPYSCPDFNNFNKWYWSIFKERFIFFNRSNKRLCAIACSKAIRILKRGRIVIIHPEGGRTSSCPVDQVLLSTKNGDQLRPIGPMAVRMAIKSHCLIIAAWVKGTEEAMPRGTKLPKFWKKVDIYLGKPFKLSKKENKENIEKGQKIFAKKLLDLATHKKDD